MAAVKEARPTKSEPPRAGRLAAARRPIWLEFARAARRVAVFANRAGTQHAESAVPKLQRKPGTLATVVADELLVTAARVRVRGQSLDVSLLSADLDEAVDALRAGGYLDDPRRLHPTPTLPADIRLTTRRVLGVTFEHISFPSCYAPPSGLPRAR